jgi:plastocyanin
MGVKKQSIMRRAAMLAPLALGGCGIGGPAYGPPAGNVAATVDMALMSFGPTVVTIHSGDAIEWRNKSLVTHTVTDDPSRHPDSALPAHGQPFDSGDVAAGEIYLRTFTEPGTYRYLCLHHDGMIATIIVQPKS